jgi:hypothetical protein
MGYSMTPQLEDILTRVTSDTLEKLAFLFTFPDDGHGYDGQEPALVGRVAFNGYFSGTLLVRISTAAVPQLAVNMLGLDDGTQISTDAQQDVFKEMLNVILFAAICCRPLPVSRLSSASGPPRSSAPRILKIRSAGARPTAW